jgi:hypothetical protein
VLRRDQPETRSHVRAVSVEVEPNQKMRLASSRIFLRPPFRRRFFLVVGGAARQLLPALSTAGYRQLLLHCSTAGIHAGVSRRCRTLPPPLPS